MTDTAPPIEAYERSAPSTEHRNGRVPGARGADELRAVERQLLSTVIRRADELEPSLVARAAHATYSGGSHQVIAVTIGQLADAGTPIDLHTLNRNLLDATPTVRETLHDLATDPDLIGVRDRVPEWLDLVDAYGADLELGRNVTTARELIDGGSAAAAVHVLEGALERHRDVARARAADDPDLDEFLATEEPPYDWLIPGFLERGDRAVITGNEGAGKSTLVRQIPVQAASGIHPFTLADIEPLSAFIVDTENSTRQVRRAIEPLRATAGDRYQPGRLRLRILGHALDIARPEVAAELAATIDRHAVDLLVIGPLYKLIDDDPIKEEPARAVAGVLDRLRQIRGTAIIIEAHSPYAEGAKAKRPQRPYGASLWSRWPEFGVYLAPDGQLQHWRGQRDQRDWPRKLQRSTPWPWAVDQDAAAEPDTRDGPTHCIEAIVALFAELGDQELSTNQLAGALRDRGRSFRNKTVSDAAKQAADEGRIRCRSGARGSLIYSAATDEQQTIPEEF